MAKKIRYVECGWCGGKGRVECDCTGDLGTWAADEDCIACGGSGICTCPACGGTGKVIED